MGRTLLKSFRTQSWKEKVHTYIPGKSHYFRGGALLPFLIPSLKLKLGKLHRSLLCSVVQMDKQTALITAVYESVIKPLKW